LNLAEKYGIDLSHEHKTACPRCRRNGKDRSGDNLHVYGPERGAFCHACEFTIPSLEHMERMGWQEEEEDESIVTREALTTEEAASVKSTTSQKGQGYRGIRDETSIQFGVRYEYDPETGKPCAQYYPTTIDGKLVGYRIRRFPKDFTGSIGQVGKEVEMIGQFFFKSENRVCVIVGGETKQLNAYQIFKDDLKRRGKEDWSPPAVVCSTTGEGGAAKQVQAQYAFFDRFEKVVICMDNDKAGKEAAEKIAKVLPKGKAFIMTMRYKDADDYVQDKEGNALGLESEFMQDYWNAKAWTPDGIVGSSSVGKRIRQSASAPRVPLPPFMYKLQKKMAGGIPLKNMVNLGSASGTGKSTIVDECTYFWIFNSPYKPGIVTLESDVGQYGTKLLSRHIGRKIDLIETPEERIAFLDQQWVMDAETHLYMNESGAERFSLIEDRDGGIESMKDKIEELIISCGCQLIILDPLQDILDGLPNEEQAVFLKWMKGMMKSHDVIFINVNHVRKSQGGKQANSTGAELFEEDMQGTSSIFKSGSCNLLFTRNKEAEDEIERNTTRMKASKIRWTGHTGLVGEFYYDNATHTMYDLDDWKSKFGPKEI
jgi:archaellum biogenesis ATPase FlaH